MKINHTEYRKKEFKQDLPFDAFRISLINDYNNLIDLLTEHSTFLDIGELASFDPTNLNLQTLQWRVYKLLSDINVLTQIQVEDDNGNIVIEALGNVPVNHFNKKLK